MRILGIMSGTSCDAVDGACVDFASAARFKTIWTRSSPFPDLLRERVLGVQAPNTKLSLTELLLLDRDLGQWFARSIRRWMRGIPPHLRPQAIALHGQTVAHHGALKGGGVSLQLGEPTWLAAEMRIPVIARFRQGDLSRGGHGAPLVPGFHAALVKRLFGRRAAGVAIHNLGGISNLTYIGPQQQIAFDTGPANCWIDAAVEALTRGNLKMDRDGRIAANAAIDMTVLRKLLRHPFLRKAPPKSTGRDDFPVARFFEIMPENSPDRVATATAYTIESIRQAYETFILKRGLPLHTILLCGGGALNPSLLAGLRSALPKVRIDSIQAYEIDPRWVEAEAFAYFGYEALQRRPSGGAWTGAKGGIPCPPIYFPDAAN